MKRLRVTLATRLWLLSFVLMSVLLVALAVMLFVAFGPPPVFSSLADGPLTVTDVTGQHLVFEGSRRPNPLRPLLLVPALIFGVLIVAVVAVARTVVRPLRRLEAMAIDLGDGKLQARSADVERDDEVGDLARAFDHMAMRVQRLVESQRALLLQVSHELRMPLSRLRLAIEMMPASEPSLRQGVDDDLGELDDLITDALTVARLDPAFVDRGITLLRVDVAAVVERVGQRFRRRWPHALQIEVGDAWMNGDERLVQRALQNLLDNAAKYSEPTTTVWLHVREAPAGLCMRIVDEGIGVDESDVAMLGTPFFRSERAQALTDGVGLGLMLVRRTVDAHGGTMTWARDDDQKRTAVELVFPRAKI
jgi:two-component system, OmpR family, sensor kinase